jgi:hypothetical protein
MVGGTSFPLQDSKSEPWSNEQKTKATPKPSTTGKAKPEARTLAGRGIATGALEVSLDNADTVIEGGSTHSPIRSAPRCRVRSTEPFSMKLQHCSSPYFAMRAGVGQPITLAFALLQ